TREDPETLALGNLEELCLLSFAELFSQPFLRLGSQNGRDQLVAPLADLGHDPLRRDLKTEPPEGAAPSFDVPRIGIHQGPVNIEDHAAYGHERKLARYERMGWTTKGDGTTKRKKRPDYQRRFLRTVAVFPPYLSASRIRSTRRPCALGL